MITLDDLIREFSRRNFRHIEDKERSPGPITEDYSDAVVSACLRLKKLEAPASEIFCAEGGPVALGAEHGITWEEQGQLKGTAWLDE
jgi:hypothetical protein